MIVTIKQTASNIKQTFDIQHENQYMQGQNGSINRLQKITLSGTNTTIAGTYKLTKWTNHIPLRHLFGYASVCRLFELSVNNEIIGSILYSKHGFLKYRYQISLNYGHIFYCYHYAKGSFDFISIYDNDKQIALLETFLNVSDYLYTHKLYILPEYDNFYDLLTFFVLYYANYAFNNRLHMSKGVTRQGVLWCITRYKDKYSPRWRDEHFPEEDFFGKTKLFQ